MARLTPFCRLLESRGWPTAVLAEWRQRTGEAFQAVRPLLQVLAENAPSYPNPRPHGLPLRVVRHADGSVVGVDPEDSGTRLLLSESDVVLYGLNVRALRTTLGAALGLRTGRDAVRSSARTIRIGTWEPKPAAAFPVVLVIRRTPVQLQTEVQRLVTDASTPLIVLTPTREHWTEFLIEFVRARKAILVPVDEVVTPAGAGFQATDAWPSYLAAFCEQARLTFPSTYSNKRRKRKRSERAAAIDALKAELHKHLRAARDHAHTTRDNGNPDLLPRPTQKQLAQALKLSPSTVSRCLADSRDRELQLLWKWANDLDAVMNYRK